MRVASHDRGLQGHAYAARSSHRRPARLLTRNSDKGLLVDIQAEDRAVIASALLTDINVDPPLGSAPRKLTWPDGSVFEANDYDGIAQLIGNVRGSVLHRYEAFKPRLFAVVAVCLGAIWVLWRYGLDILASVAIAFTPPIMIEQIDKGSMQTIDFAMAEPSRLTEGQKDYVEGIYHRLVASLPEDEQQKHSFDLLFRDMPGMGPNAFALPGGTMVITDAFVYQFPQPDVIAGVLGHEIGHVVEQHGLKRLYRTLSLYLLISFLAGDTGPILEDIVLEGNLLLSLSHSRTQETAADEFGLTLADAAGFDPAGLRLFFEELHEEYGHNEPAQWMSTHPSSAERVKEIDAFIDGL